MRGQFLADDSSLELNTQFADPMKRKDVNLSKTSNGLRRMLHSWAWLFFLIASLFPANGQDFFSVGQIRRHSKPSKNQTGVWVVEKDAKNRPFISGFVECMEVVCLTKENIPAAALFAKAYYFDDANKLIFTQEKPSKSGKKATPASQHEMPVIFKAGVQNSIFFEVPPSLRGIRWRMLVVFGDKHEASVATYPAKIGYMVLDFPEKSLVDRNPAKGAKRKIVQDSVVEYVATTRNPKHPKITLFLRPPKGIRDWSEVKGVYALVVLANGVEEIRRRMDAVELDGDESGAFAFANKHKLAILVWGSRRIWNPRMNHDDYRRQEARELDRDFDLVANAWERAVQHFHQEYDIPTKNFILRGSCGAAQWAKRLCLRKPDYFLAAHIHLAGSYDRPTPEASRVLWCVTTSEVDGGYGRSLRFLTACRDAAYPIIYKATLPKAGLKGMGNEFFEYAMTLKERRAEYDRKMADSFRNLQIKEREETQAPWVEEFANPPFYGDVVNQELSSAKDVEMIPAVFRTSLPTKRIADTWKD